MTRRIIGIREKLPILESLPLSFQHLTAMFGATIIVPILLDIDPAIALLRNGLCSDRRSYLIIDFLAVYKAGAYE